MIALREREPFALGSKRLVFAHPDDPALVVKVFKRKYADGGSPWTPWQALRRRYVCVHLVLRELREHIEARLEGEGLPWFVPRVVGLVDTDLGLGMVVEAARGRDGAYAPTLRSMLEAGRVDGRVMADLERFCAEVGRCGLVIGDLHAQNVVYAHDDERGPHFMLVDGLGDKTLVPLLKMSRLLNSRARRRKARKLLAMARRWRAAGAPGAK